MRAPSSATARASKAENPQSNAILERVHKVIGNMLCTAEIDMAQTVTDEDVSDFICNASWAI